MAKLDLPADADERAVLATLQEHALRYDQELARTLARNRGEDQEQAVLYGSAPTNVKSVLKSTLDLGEMTTDVCNRVLKYVDENMLDVKRSRISQVRSGLRSRTLSIAAAPRSLNAMSRFDVE